MSTDNSNYTAASSGNFSTNDADDLDRYDELTAIIADECDIGGLNTYLAKPKVLIGIIVLVVIAMIILYIVHSTVDNVGSDLFYATMIMWPLSIFFIYLSTRQVKRKSVCKPLKRAIL